MYVHITSAPGLFIYSQDSKIDPPYNDVAIVGQYKVEIKMDLLEDENVNIINFNLFDGTTYMVRKESFIRCEDNEYMADYLCGTNHYTWRGEIIDQDYPNQRVSPVTIVSIDGSIAGSISGMGNKYIYTIGHLSEDEGSFFVLTKIDPSKLPPEDY